jgi:hypothetical protein
MKCIDKKQAGQKTKRIYEKEAKTPCQRILETQNVDEKLKERLREKRPL